MVRIMSAAMLCCAMLYHVWYSHERKHEAQVRAGDVVGYPFHELRHSHRWHRSRMKNGFLAPLSVQHSTAQYSTRDLANTHQLARGKSHGMDKYKTTSFEHGQRTLFISGSHWQAPPHSSGSPFCSTGNCKPHRRAQ